MGSGSSQQDALRDEFSPRLISDQVYELLRRSILDGTQRPASRLVESEIARSLGISQAPVRDAVRRLVHEGLATSVPRRGSFVTEISETEATVGRRLRAAVEQVGAQLFIESASEERVAQLKDIGLRLVSAAQNSDIAAIRLLDVEFHRTVIEAAGSELLSRVWSIMEPSLISQHLIGDPHYSGNWEPVAREHLLLAELLEAGEPQAAGQGFYDHAIGRGASRPPHALECEHDALLSSIDSRSGVRSHGRGGS